MKPSTCKFCFALLLALLLSMERSNAQFLLTGQRKTAALNFRIIKNLIIIPLKINNKGPYNFVLDTGVGLLLITEPSLRDSLHLVNLRNINITGFGEGEILTASIAPSFEIEIGPNIRGTVTGAILHKDAFSLSSYVGLPVHGLLGYEFFSSFIVKINYDQKVIRVYRPDTFYIPKKGYKVPISIEEGKPYLTGELLLPDKKALKIKLVIDSGAGHPIWLETFLGRPFEPPEIKIRANLGVGLTGSISGYIGRIPELKIGKYILHNVITAFPDYEYAAAKVSSVQRDGNLGNTILQKFNVVFDYQRGSMFLKPNYTYKQPFEHDMSGIEFSASGPELQRIFISRIETGSAAEDAGLRENDELLAVNLQPVKNMDMDSIYGIFRSKPGRNILLQIARPGAQNAEIIILTLKRRI